MIAPDTIGSMVAASLTLTLALRSYRSRQVPLDKTVRMIVVWVLIITVLALVFGRMGANQPR